MLGQNEIEACSTPNDELGTVLLHRVLDAEIALAQARAELAAHVAQARAVTSPNREPEAASAELDAALDATPVRRFVPPNTTPTTCARCGLAHYSVEGRPCTKCGSRELATVEPTPTQAAQAAHPRGHHPSFTESARKLFFAELTHICARFGLDKDTAYELAQTRATGLRPSQMSARNRERYLTWLAQPRGQDAYWAFAGAALPSVPAARCLPHDAAL